MTAQLAAVVDYSHMGRKITGIERISADLFSPEALERFDVLHSPSASTLGMIREQWLGIPLLARKHARSKLLFPGFPPSIIVSLLFRNRVVPYIHDLFLLERTDELNIRARLYMRPSFIYAIRHLKNFFVNSKTTEASLRKVCRVDARIMTLRPRALNAFGLDKAVRHLPGRGEALKIIMLGTLEPRKNYEFAAELTAAFSRLSGRSVELHISGREGWGDVVSRLQRFSHVHYHGYLSVMEMRELVGEGHLFLCTSLDEGLGLPLLEVLHSGIPMVVSDIPVFREVVDKAGAIFISNRDIDNACKTLLHELDEPFFAEATARSDVALDSWNEGAEMDLLEFKRFLEN